MKAVGLTQHPDGALHDAAVRGDVPRLISLLDAGWDVDARYAGGTSLIMAATFGQAATVRVLLERGADPNAVDNDNASSLIWTGRYGLQTPEPEGGVTVVRLLLEYGADPNHQDEAGETPLVLAATEGNVEAIQVLLDYGAEINAMTGYGTTALVAASSSFEAAKVLLEAGADVNGVFRRWTPLHHAVHNSNVDTVKLFLAAGADVNARDNVGQTMLTLARERNNPEIISLLAEAGARE